MPITESFIPKNLGELNQKVRDNVPGQEHLIVEDVKAHLEKEGRGIYKHSVEDAVDVALTATKCIVFLIGGKFKVGEKVETVRGQGYLVEDEKTIQLQRYTIVVIIDQE